MKSKIAKGVILICIVAFAGACNTKSTETAAAVDTAAIKQEIQNKENDFAAVFNSREIKNIGYYADDAISYSQNRPSLVGKVAIVNFLKENLDSLERKISFTTNEVFVSDGGNQVVEIGYYKLVDASNTLVNSGNYMSLFVKRDGKYVSLRDMSVSDMTGE